MKLATVRDGSRDGALVVVSADGRRFTRAAAVAATLQAALDDWLAVEPRLRALTHALESGRAPAEAVVYQGGSGVLLGPCDDIPLADETWGLDFESEVCVVLGDVAQGTSAAAAGATVRLILLCNDITLRNLVPAELAKGFGFFQGKPATAFSPFAVTPDELGAAWHDGRVHRRVRTTYNGTLVGDVEAGPEMHFSFFDLVAHIARTRAFAAGTILGGGTVSNADPARGISCLAERRAIETIAGGAPRTSFMKPGDTVSIDMLDDDGHSVCGRIAQKVIKHR